MFDRLFRKARTGHYALAHSFETAQRVIQDYEDFLKTSAPLPGCVADESQLPHPKEDIKQALSTCIGAIRDPELIEHLKHGYLMLCAWQHNVGINVLGVNFTELDLEQDPMTVAALIQQQSASIEQWKPWVEAEQASSHRELLALGV
jgi:hypothetical protein